MSYRQTTVSGFPAVALRSAEVEVVVVPAIGMKLTHLRRLRGREWLWRNEQIPLALPRPGASYIEPADSGGWDDCFPTVGPSPLPGAPAGAPPLPDHGELWSADWTSSVAEHAEGTTLTSVARGVRLRYEFHRAVTLRRTGRSSGCTTGCGTPVGRRFPGSGRRTRCSTCSRAAPSACPE